MKNKMSNFLIMWFSKNKISNPFLKLFNKNKRSSSSEFMFLLMKINPGLFTNEEPVPGYKRVSKGMFYVNQFLFLAQTLTFMKTKTLMFSDDFFVCDLGIFSAKSFEEWKKVLAKFEYYNDVLEPHEIVSKNKYALKMAYFLIDYFEDATIDELLWITKLNMDWKKHSHENKSINLKEEFNLKNIHSLKVFEPDPSTMKFFTHIISEWKKFKI